MIEFHGTLATCYCEGCLERVETKEFLKSPRHKDCGGIVRPNVVLYDEQIDSENIYRSLQTLAVADTIVIVGTSFRVYPFASLIEYATDDARIFTINKEPVDIVDTDAEFLDDATLVFEVL